MLDIWNLIGILRSLLDADDPDIGQKQLGSTRLAAIIRAFSICYGSLLSLSLKVQSRLDGPGDDSSS